MYPFLIGSLPHGFTRPERICSTKLKIKNGRYRTFFYDIFFLDFDHSLPHLINKTNNTFDLRLIFF